MKKIIVIILSILGVLFLISVGLVIYWIMFTDYKYTGDDLFKAVNEYRVSKKLKPIELDVNLCDNLVERWAGIKEGKRHEGFDEWLKKEKIDVNPKYFDIAELYIVDASTPQWAISWWQSSPGHRLILENKDMRYGCAYADDGTGVLILASPRK
ncbi:MAG: CAP domain-containing protein [Candidatus Omnitrophica bacterium]|nr:CAP domain-containing protein [Candidatus Omnitrophota bacterium]